MRKPNDLPTSHLIAYIILGIAVVIFNVYALEYVLSGQGGKGRIRESVKKGYSNIRGGIELE